MYCARWAMALEDEGGTGDQGPETAPWNRLDRDKSLFGRKRLPRKTNLSYYGRKGLDAQGRDIEQHSPKESLIASIESVGEGRNLQAWSRNLITLLVGRERNPKRARTSGRTHRQGQQADEVVFDIITTSIEHVLAFEQARRDAREEEQRTGLSQRLNFADISFPTPDEICLNRHGPRWIK